MEQSQGIWINSSIFEEVKDGKWHHIVQVFDRKGNVKIYIDGKLEGDFGKV